MEKTNMHESELLAEVVRAIDRSGLANETIATRSGVSTPTISHWRTGYTKAPRIDTLEKVAGALGYRITMVEGVFKLAPQYDTAATVAAKAKHASEFVGLWRKYQH
jgi:transcriptional regulator with XRE-family HTH domain